MTDEEATMSEETRTLRSFIHPWRGIYVRRKLPLPREPAGVIPKEGTNLYWLAKLQGAVERQYSFYADSCLVKVHVLL
jgi:hypothetical protein